MKMIKCWCLMLVLTAGSVLPLVGAENEAKTYSAADYQAAYGLLEAMQVPAQLKQTLSGMVDMQMKANPQMMPYRDVFNDFFAKYLSYDALKEGYAVIYLDSFTPEELRELTKFYLSPIGKKLASKTSEFAIRGAQLGQRAMLEHQGELQAALGKAVAEQQAAK